MKENERDDKGQKLFSELKSKQDIRDFIIKRLKYEFKPFVKEFSIVFSGFIFVSVVYLLVKNEINSLEGLVRQKTQQLKVIDDSIIESKNSLLVWDQIKKQLQSRRGLDIEAFRSLVEVIQLKHAISDLEIILTTPTTRNDSKNQQFVNLEFNEIEMNFASITDVEAYRFLVELINKVPGILHIEKFEMSAKTDIEAAIIQTLKEGEIQSMVEISVLFKWHNIIDL